MLIIVHNFHHIYPKGSNQKSYVEMDNLVPISTPGQSSEPPSVTPPPARKQQRVTSFFPQLIKTRDASSRMSLGETWPVPTTPVSSQPMPPSAPSFVPGPAAPLDLQHPAGTFSFFRPRVNSLLHLLGVWLFDASLVGADVIGTQREEDWGNDKLQQYEAGRAQACGTLCRIFCSVKTDEEILQAYVARFYAVIFYGLKVDLVGRRVWVSFTDVAKTFRRIFVAICICCYAFVYLWNS